MAGKFLNPSLNTNTATVSTVTESSKRAAIFAEQSHTKDGTVFILYHARIHRKDRGFVPLLKNHLNIRFHSNTYSDPLKITVIKPAFNNGPSLARQRNAI